MWRPVTANSARIIYIWRDRDGRGRDPSVIRSVGDGDAERDRRIICLRGTVSPRTRSENVENVFLWNPSVIRDGEHVCGAGRPHVGRRPRGDGSTRKKGIRAYIFINAAGSLRSLK